MLEFFRILLADQTEIDRNLQTLLENLPSETKIIPKKNTGNAVLYECAKTILSLKVEAKVKAAGVEIINRVMANRDINSLYVSLDLLGHMAREVQTTNFNHLEIVLDSLRERDTSIKLLAMKVLVILSNQNNVESKIGFTQILLKNS